jgi:hypothetical protein
VGCDAEQEQIRQQEPTKERQREEDKLVLAQTISSLFKDEAILDA